MLSFSVCQQCKITPIDSYRGFPAMYCHDCKTKRNRYVSVAKPEKKPEKPISKQKFCRTCGTELFLNFRSRNTKYCSDCKHEKELERQRKWRLKNGK